MRALLVNRRTQFIAAAGLGVALVIIRSCEEGVGFRLWCMDHFDRAKNVAR